jgi:hypothetical protein
MLCIVKARMHVGWLKSHCRLPSRRGGSSISLPCSEAREADCRRGLQAGPAQVASRLTEPRIVFEGNEWLVIHKVVHLVTPVTSS